MSIAYEINRLKRNKQQVKEQVNVDKDIIYEGREFIRGETVRHYPSGIKSMEMSYKDFIPVHTSTESLIETERAGTIIERHLMGNTIQNGTPTPSSPVAIQSVTGLQNFSICGKNFLQYKNLPTRTENGITITNNNDGTFTVNGTATANVSLAIDPDNFMPMKGTWRITGCPSGGSSSTYMLSAYVGYWGEGSPNIDTGSGTNITYTGNVKVRFFIKSGTTCNNLLFKPMVTYNTSATYNDFEPYKLAKKRTRNLFDKYNVIAGYRFDSEGGLYQNNGCNATNFIDVQPNTTYSTSWTIVLNEVICLYDAEFNFTRRLISGTSFTTEPNEYYIRADVIDDHLSTAQIEEGSTTTSYVDPYETNFEIDLGSIELNKIGNYQDFIRKGTGKNLADTEKVNLGKTLGNSGELLNGMNNRTTIFQIAVKPSTQYSLSVASNYQIGNLFYYKEDETFLSMQSSGWENNKVITTPSGAYYISFATRVSTDATMVESDLTNLHIQIEENSNVTYYEPYGYKDKWYIERNVGKEIFDGSSDESWFLQGSGTYYKYQWSKALPLKYNVANSPIYCSHFQQITVSQGDSKNTIGIANGIYSGYSISIVTNITTLADFKTWLSNNNVIVYYVLSSPTFETISDSTLISQLNENIYLLEGQNNISVSGNLPAGIDVDYIERVNKHLIGNTNESAE